MEDIKWYHKKWVRVLAVVLVVIMIFTTIGYTLLRMNAEDLYAELAGSDEYLQGKNKDFSNSFDADNIILNLGLYSDLKELMQNGDYDHAIEKINSLLESETDTLRIEQLHELLCELQYNVGNYEEAAKEADICIERNILDDTVYLFYYIGAISYMHEGDYNTSVKYIDNILDMGEDSQLYYYRGINNMALEDYVQASTDFSKSLELGKEDTELYYDLGICLISIGDVDEGISKLSYVIEKDDSPELTMAAQNIIVAIGQGD